MLVFRWYMNLPPEYLLHRYTSTDIYASPHPPTDLWDAYCLTGGWCLLKGETNHKCKLLNISKDHFQNSLQIRFVQIEKYVCPTPLHVSKGHLQNTDTGRNLFPRGCQQQHGSDPLQGPENNRWWRTHGKSPSRQQTNLLFFSPATTGGPMNSLRKWLYRPRRDDKSLLAKFWWVQSFISIPFFAFLYRVCRSPTKVQCQKQTKTWVQHTLASLWQSKCWHKRPNVQTPYFANFRWRPNTLECCSIKKYCSFPPLFTLLVTAVQHFIKSPITSYTAGENTL